MTTEPAGDILVERHGALGLVTLNRPQALNALNDAMVDGLRAALDSWRDDKAVQHVLIRGAGSKAFCAGGDIRLMHDLGKAGKHAASLDFWAREYRLNSVIKHFPKPYIALIDGIVMGGGVGVSLHGSHRLAGPNYLFAMPEVGIGFFPDVGASYALARLPGATGAWLAVTGARLRRADALELGLATHAIRAGCTDDLIEGLASGGDVQSIISGFVDSAGEAPLRTNRAAIDRHFAHTTLKDIIASLAEAGADDRFATETLASLATKSPTSMALAVEQVKRGATLDFNAAMMMEYRIVSRIAYGSDFYEGVRALIIDKDNAPRWSPSCLDDVDMSAIAAHFMPLEHDLILPEA
ncbi:CaiD Enoyl-CoA hydratase/carnithine racemase [Rhabdaerophilaceae bacterium]